MPDPPPVEEAAAASARCPWVERQAQMRARLDAPVRAGEPHVVTSWLVNHDARTHLGACAIHGPDGGLRACSEGLWIELRDPRTLGART
jgi:hypothetical protein